MTKSDKTKQKDRSKVQKKWEDILKVKPICVSSKTGMNRTKLWNLLDVTAIPELADIEEETK